MQVVFMKPSYKKTTYLKVRCQLNMIIDFYLTYCHRFIFVDMKIKQCSVQRLSLEELETLVLFKGSEYYLALYIEMKLHYFMLNPICFKVCLRAHGKIKFVIAQKLLYIRCRHTSCTSLTV